MTDRFVIGFIGAPHGIKGFLKVRSCSGEIDHLLKLQEVTVSKDGVEKLLKIAENAPASPFVLIRFEGIDNPEKAKTLSGSQLLAGREQAAPLAQGEFYIEDLKNLTVTAENGENIGHIIDIIEGGGGELAEIMLCSGEKRFVPFREEFFSEICPEKGRLILKNLWILE